jgi:hypothetical protein
MMPPCPGSARRSGRRWRHCRQLPGIGALTTSVVVGAALEEPIVGAAAVAETSMVGTEAATVFVTVTVVGMDELLPHPATATARIITPVTTVPLMSRW